MTGEVLSARKSFFLEILCYLPQQQSFRHATTEVVACPNHPEGVLVKPLLPAGLVLGQNECKLIIARE